MSSDTDLIVFDTESYPHDWIFCAKNKGTQEKFVFHNEPKEFKEWFNDMKRDHIFAAYNLNGYDRHIINAIHNKGTPLFVKGISDMIIKHRERPYLNWVNFNGYDIMPEVRAESLKTLEGYAGKEIWESDVAFDIDRKLNSEELEKSINYCFNDVDEATDFLSYDINYKEYMAKRKLCELYNIPLFRLSSTKAMLAEIILKAKKQNFPLEPIKLVHPYSTVPDDVLNYYKNGEFKYGAGIFESIDCSGNHVYHSIGAGGLHGAIPNYIAVGEFLYIDVTSYYPNIMIIYELLSRACPHPEILKEMLALRLEAKANGDDGLSYALKIAINSIFGNSGAEFSKMLDMTNMYSVTCNGQLMLIELIVALCPYSHIINSNTDGLIVKPVNKEMCLKVIHEWEERTKMHLEIKTLIKIIQKDVNNYAAMYDNGKWETKGAAFKQPSLYDCNLGIVKKATLNYFNGIKVIDTLKEETDLRMFQMIVKLSSVYESNVIINNGIKENLKQRSNRIFAVNNGAQIFKYREGKFSKIADTPDSVMILNEDITKLNAKDFDIDLNWYENLINGKITDVIFKKEKSDKTRNRKIVNHSIFDY